MSCFPSSPQRPAAAASLFREAGAKKKPLPRRSDLLTYAIGLDEFARRHTVVCCAKCEEKFGRRVFSLLRFVRNRAGEKAMAVGFRPQPFGKSRTSHGEDRVVWIHAVGLSVTCEEGHQTTIDPQTGEVTCRERDEND